MDYWGYGEQDSILCIGCEKRVAVDIHHLSKRGMGSSKKKDTPENLVALCRGCHTFAEHNKEFNKIITERLNERITRRIYG